MQTSKLRASLIRLLRKLALFYSTIKYRTGKSNNAADALSWCPLSSISSFECDTDINEVDAIPYSSFCEVVDLHLNGTKVRGDLKTAIQKISCVVEPLVKEEGQWEIQF